MSEQEYWTMEQFQEYYRLNKNRSDATKAEPKTKTPRVGPDWIEVLVDQIRLRGLPAPEREYRFHAERKWRFDLHWKHIGQLLAVEVEGAVFGRPVVCHQCHQQVKRQVKGGRWVVIREGGRHNSGTGIEGDMEKYNEAALYGWKVIRVTSTMIQDGRALDWIERALLVEECGNAAAKEKL